jgi:hypothetical protein
MVRIIFNEMHELVKIICKLRRGIPIFDRKHLVFVYKFIQPELVDDFHDVTSGNLKHAAIHNYVKKIYKW